jgi:hypothetical protein
LRTISAPGRTTAKTRALNKANKFFTNMLSVENCFC